MATFFQDATVGTWAGNTMTGTLTGDVSRSGNTVTLSNMVLSLRCPAGQAWGSDNLWFEVNGTRTAFTCTAAGDGYSLGSYSLNSTSFSVAASDTSASVGWTDNDGVSGSFTVTFPAGSSAPTGLTISNITPGTDSVTATVSITDWGGGTTSTRYRELSVCTAQSAAQRKWVMEYGDALSSNITVDNTATSTAGAVFTITPNSSYYLTMYTTNGVLDTGNTQYIQVVTLAEAPTISVGTITDTSVQILYTASADGGQYNKKIRYSLDGTTWVTGATVTSGATTSGTFTITGLTAGTSYSIQTRVSTPAGTTTGTTLSVTTTGGASPKLYGPVSDGVGGYETELVEKLYGPVDDGNGGYETKKITKLYGAVSDGNGGYETKLIYEDLF